MPIVGFSLMPFLGGVGEASPVPRITSPATASGRIGDPFTYQITASVPSGAGPITSYGATGLPAWASINTLTGEITGTPVAPHGITNVTLSATNAEGTGTRTLRMTIAARPLIVWAAYYGPAPASMQPTEPGVPDSLTVFETLPNTIARPAVGTVMVAPAPIGSWGPCFAYPATLPPPTSIIDSIAGNVTSTFTSIIVSIAPPNPADPPQDYRVFYLASFVALAAPGTTSTLRI